MLFDNRFLHPRFKSQQHREGKVPPMEVIRPPERGEPLMILVGVFINTFLPLVLSCVLCQ